MNVQIGDRFTTAKLGPVVEVAYDEVEPRGAHGLEAVQVVVEDEQGLRSRFWVNVRVKNGRPVATITTKPDLAGNRQVSKSVTGTFRDL
jgi:hypothetical protein